MTENKKYDIGTLGWLRKHAKKDGFDNVRNWQIWKRNQKWLKELENKYGKEFVEWAIQNKDKIPKYWLSAGCKTSTEYLDKCSKNAGFKDYAERTKEWTHRTGRNLPKEFNEDCSSHFGEFTENLMIQTFEDPIRMPYGNPGFDWKCKNGEKIDNKGACLIYTKGRSPRWILPIEHNNIADWFILSMWDNRDSLNPLHVLAFHKNDIVRGRKFCEFENFSITNTLEKLKELEKHEVTDRLDKLKELCNRERE